MAYGKCILDGYVYEYNAPEATNPRVRAICATDTLSGRYYTDWGSDPSRRDIVQTWPVMGAAVFAALDAKFAKPGTLAFTDDDGTVYTVYCEALTAQRKTAGGVAYLNIRASMKVVSSP